MNINGLNNEPVHTILGDCFGIALIPRGYDDPHVIFAMVVEDDEMWYLKSSGSGYSSFWLTEAVKVTQDALDWVKANCDEDSSGFGWVFRPGTWENCR